jgi:hypothetical protein
MEYIYIVILVWLIGCFISLAVRMEREMEFENSTLLRDVRDPCHIIVFEWQGEWCFIKHVKPGYTTTESAVFSKNAKVVWAEYIHSGEYIYIK